MFVKPAAGLNVVNPMTGRYLIPSGETVVEDSFWLRRIAAGDVIWVDPPPPGTPNPKFPVLNDEQIAVSSVGIVATNVQDALTELLGEIQSGGGTDALWAVLDTLTAKSVKTKVMVVGSDSNSRDNPSAVQIFRNEGLPNNPMFCFGNPYIAGIGEAAYGVWYSDDTMVIEGVRTWRLVLSGEASGTIAAVLDGTRHSAVESFVQNGDFKPWMRIEGYRHGITFGAGGSLALAGHVTRSGGVVTVQTQQEHRVTAGAALWKSSGPGSVGSDLTLFGADSSGPSSFVVASVIDSTHYTYNDAGSDGTSAGSIYYSTETDTAFGRDASSGKVYAFVDGQDGSELRANGSMILRALASCVYFNQQPKFGLWFNGGGQAMSNQTAFIVGTGAGNQTSQLPHATGDAADGLFCMMVNFGQGGSNTLTVSGQDGALVNGAANVVLPADWGGWFLSAGGNWFGLKMALA